MRTDRQTFFARVRERPFGGSLTQAQVDGMSAILAEWERYGWPDLRWLAYMLATTFHETARTMQPIKEYGGNAYFHRMYDINGDRPHVARALGNTQPGDGVKFAGRGYVQLTGRANYAKASQVVGRDLIANPDLALDPKIASEIMFHGMANGWFTGRKLADYLNDEITDWRNARRIINGVDRAEVIARYAVNFHDALMAARQSAPPADAPVKAPAAPEEAPPVVVRPTGFIFVGLAGLVALIAYLVLT